MTRDRRVGLAVLAALVVAIFGLGGAPVWAVALIGAVVATGLGFLVTSRRQLAGHPLLLVLLGLATALTAAQLVPLPAAVVATLDPVGHDLVVAGARVLGDSPPGWRSLSRDPAGTWHELGKLASYLGLAYLALWLSTSHRAGRWLRGFVVCGATSCPLARMYAYRAGCRTDRCRACRTAMSGWPSAPPNCLGQLWCPCQLMELPSLTL